MIPLLPFAILLAILNSIPMRTGILPSGPQENVGYCVPNKGAMAASIPQPLNRIIKAAANHWKADPYAVAVLFYSENGFTFQREPPPPYGNGAPWPVSPMAAGGPFQFIPSTWAAYRNSNPANLEGDINDLIDAAYAAAHLLADLGATEGAPLGSFENAFADGTIINAWRMYNSGNLSYLPGETRRYILAGIPIYNSLKGAGTDTSDPTAGCPASGSGSWHAPLRVMTLSSPFGYRLNPVSGSYELHDGLDFSAPTGTVVYALTSGKVTSAGWMGLAGNAVIVDYGEYLSTVMHLSHVSVQSGQQVGPGTELGQVGSTGQSTGPHLHLRLNRVEQGGGMTPIDPYKVLLEHGIALPKAIP